MLSRFSVKKPYTVVVGIVLILILGFVSFTKMTTDLLPDINLPYAVVMTTYPGASPEEVEETVTKEIEESMATVSNIENVQSVSRENVSLVILEFAQATNMDSVSLEMRENLDQIGSDWDETIGKPIIMKLNPDMMPVMVAAVEQEGLDRAGISDLVNDKILSDIESLEGVASVSTSGDLEQSVEVVLRQDKIDKMNELVQAAVKGEFTEAEDELHDAQKELNDGQQKLEDSKAEVEDGKAQLENGQASAAAQLGDAQGKLSSAQSELLENEMDVKDKLASVEAGLTQIESAKKEIEASEKQLKQAEQAIAARDKLAAQMPAIEEAIPKLEDAISQLNDLAAIMPLTEEQQATLDDLQRQLTEAKTAQSTYETLNTQLADMTPEKVAASKKELASAKKELEKNKKKLETAKTQLEAALKQISSGKTTLSAALAELNSKEISAVLEMASAQAKLATGEAQIAAGESQMESGQKQLDEGWDQLDEARKDALDGADLEKVITKDLVTQILTAQNFSMPAGYITEDNVKYLIRVGDKFTQQEDMENLVLFDFDLDGLAPIKLSDVADVTVTDNSSEIYASVNGKPGVVLTMQKQTGYSTGEVSNRIQDYFKKAQEEAKTHFTILMDQGVYIDMVVNSVLENLLYGAILAILILFVFLRDVRPTFIVACSIPISVLAAVVLMYFSGITLNIISLSGLALGVGMLVDNSIVVIENIYRLRGLGVPARKAAVEGAKQVAGAIAASTLTTVCVFLPIVFTEGITRQLFVDMGLTIAYSLLASLAIALTLVPMMSAGMLKKPKEVKSGLMDRLLNWYGKFMAGVLKLRWGVLALALVLLLASGAACLSKGMVYIPEMESTQASLNVTMPEGSTMEETAAMSDTIMQKLSDIKDIDDIGAMAGGGGIMSMMGMGNSNTENVTMYLILSDKKELTNDELAAAITDRTKDLDCEVEVETSSMDMSALGGSGVSVEIKGKDTDKLKTIATDFAKIIEKVDGTTEVSDGQEEPAEEMRMVVKKSRASEYNLTVAQIYQQIAAKIKEDSKATTLATDTKDYDVNVIDESASEFTREDVKDIKLTYTDKEGKSKQVAVDQVADFVSAQGLEAITRDGQSRYMTVTAELKEGYNITNVAAKVEQELKKYDMPAGYEMEMTGEDETINDSMMELMKMLGLAVVFIYLIMVAQFQSLMSPFIVMFTIPLAFTGGFLGLFLTGNEMSIIAMIGFVMLSGIIVNNGIVLVDYINQLRAEGWEKRAAIIEAGKTRMRPIMMTALTTILGLLTMAMGIGMGSDMVQPMAIVTIGGLLYGTLLTLLVVPCIYDIMNRKEYKVIEIEEDEDEGKLA